MAIIWTTNDCRGKQVNLTDDAWSHALGKRPFLAGHEGQARLTVEDPNICTREGDGSINYYRRGAINGRPQLYLHVLVRDIDGATGDVHTAWPCEVVDNWEEILCMRI